MKASVLSISLMLAVSGCSTAGLSGNGSSVIGAFAGNSTSEQPVAARIVDSMAGGLIGGTIGQGLENSEKRRALEAEYRALEYTATGQSVGWRSERSGRSGQVTAAAPYRVGSQDCRQYRHTLYSGSDQRTAQGVACRNADGSWTPLA